MERRSESGENKKARGTEITVKGGMFPNYLGAGLSKFLLKESLTQKELSHKSFTARNVAIL